jgi:hypothetical protein
VEIEEEEDKYSNIIYKEQKESMEKTSTPWKNELNDKMGD